VWKLCFTAVLCAGMLGFTSAEARAQASGGVQVWLTTADRTSLFQEQPKGLAFAKAATAKIQIDVDDAVRFQQIDGFGFAMTGGSAQLLMRMAPHCSFEGDIRKLGWIDRRIVPAAEYRRV
jgi:hypothetical protein